MKYRVLFNRETKYLAITTSDVESEELVELFSSEPSFEDPSGNHISLTNCKVFCMGYLQGNNGEKAKNQPNDFI